MSSFNFLTRLCAAAIGLFLFATIAEAQSPDMMSHTVNDNHIKPLPPTAYLLNPYEAALKFKQQGNYAKAIEILEPEAKKGLGFEQAMLVLGQCYIASADKAATPEAGLEATKKGAAWVKAAADSGSTSAQEQMARIYIEGGRFKVEPVEAGKWYLLWKNNPARFTAIPKPFDPALEQKLKGTLTDAQWEQAGQAAMAYAQKQPPS